MGILKGIGSLLKAAPKINRRLTPEEIAKKDLMEAKPATQAAKGRYEKASTQLDEVLKPYRGEMMSQSRLHGDKWMKDSWTPQMPRYAPSTAMRAKKVGDETMEMIRDSVMKMDLPPAKKVEAIKSAATAVRNATPAQLAKANPAELSMDIIKMIGATGAGFVGGAMMEGAAREGRLPEMIQDSFLVKPEFRGMREPGDAVGKMLGATMLGASAGGDYDEPDPEPGLEEGSIADLLLLNRLFGD